MPIFENRGGYLFVKINEPYSLKGTFAFLQEFANICNREDVEKALIDILILDERVSIWDRYQIGEEYVRVVGSKIRVAIVVKRELIDLTTENVVVNRTGRIKVFHEMESALKWLEADG